MGHLMRCCDGFDSFALIGNGGCGSCGCNGFAGFGGEPEPVEPIVDWNFRMRPSGIIHTAGVVDAWAAEIQGFVMPKVIAAGGGDVLVGPFMNAIGIVPQPIVFLGARMQGQFVGTGPMYAGMVNAMTWLFALTIPSFVPPGNGPSSTQITPQKNFPLYFKSGAGGMIMGSQPASMNCDTAVDIQSWFGLDAVIAVQQGAGLNPRFSCFVNTLGAFQMLATTGEDPIPQPSVDQLSGLSLGGWYDQGGEFSGPTAECSNQIFRYGDALIDAQVLWTATEFYGMSA
jgi:hypothetical protein